MPRGDPVYELSAMLNAAHKRVVPHWETPSWFKLFRQVDSDGSGLISFDEFVEMVRTDLKLSPRALPERALRIVWLTLDTDGSGYLSSGEFGAFMRLGMPQLDRAATARSSSSRRSPPRTPQYTNTAFTSPRRAAPTLPGEFMTSSSMDAKKHRAQLDASIERKLRASRQRYLLGSEHNDEPSRTQTAAGHEDGSDVQALRYRLKQAQAHARRLEQVSSGPCWHKQLCPGKIERGRLCYCPLTHIFDGCAWFDILPRCPWTMCAQALDIREVQCAAAEELASQAVAARKAAASPAGGPASLAVLLARASREELVEAMEGLSPARRDLLMHCLSLSPPRDPRP